MSAMKFYLRIVHALEKINAPYMIVGAFAGWAFGVRRVTFDVDILVDLRAQDLPALAAEFPLPRYYADPEMMRNSMRLGIMFNLIDTSEGVKADLVPMTREPGYRAAFARRVRQTFEDEEGNRFDAWCAQPADIIIGKLKAWTEGRSNKHPADIHQMLVFSLSDLGTIQIDQTLVTTEAARLGSETLALWKELVARAEAEVRKNKNG
jgi:hypothetical protein